MKKGAKNLFTRYFLVIFSIILITGLVMGIAMGFSFYNYINTSQTELLSANARSVASSLTALNRERVDFEDVGVEQVMTGTLSLLSSNLTADVFICDQYGQVVICRH